MVRRALIVVSLVLMLGTNRAAAQTEIGLPEPPAPALRIPILVWVSGVAADQATTYWFSSRYGDMIREQNPLIRPLDHHPLLLVTAGAAIDAASGWAALKFLAPRHPRLARAAFYGAAFYRAYLAAHNVRMMQLASEMRSATTQPH